MAGIGMIVRMKWILNFSLLNNKCKSVAIELAVKLNFFICM